MGQKRISACSQEIILLVCGGESDFGPEASVVRLNLKGV
jgi:hypothetical protein